MQQIVIRWVHRTPQTGLCALDLCLKAPSWFLRKWLAHQRCGFRGWWCHLSCDIKSRLSVLFGVVVCTTVIFVPNPPPPHTHLGGDRVGASKVGTGEKAEFLVKDRPRVPVCPENSDIALNKHIAQPSRTVTKPCALWLLPVLLGMCFSSFYLLGAVI